MRYVSSPMPSVESSAAWPGSTPKYPSIAGHHDLVDLLAITSREASRPPA